MTKVNSIGFTGTQNGITVEQLSVLRLFVTNLEFREIHHGDCIGADETFADHIEWWNGTIAIDKIKRVIHPPDNPSKRAFCQGDFIHVEKPYLERNKDIVYHSHLLIACPGEMKEQLRSGTWSTVRYARQNNKTIFIIMPNGTVNIEVPGFY